MSESPDYLLHPDHVDSLLTSVDLVRTGQASTRPEIVRLTGLGRSVVKQRVDQAIEFGLLEDAEMGPSTGGRAPRQLRFVSERASILVAVFGARGVAFGISDLSGNIVAHYHKAWDIVAGPEASMDLVVAEFEQLIAAPRVREVWGIVVGLPGPVEFESGRPAAPPIMPGWNGFDVRARLQSHFAAPVWIDRDANLMALGEMTLIDEPAARNMLFIKVGTGVGAGLISRGDVHRGADGGAGDVGHIIITDHPEIVCRCGQVGCLEAVAGGWALARDALREARAGTSSFLVSRMEARGGEIYPLDVVEGSLMGDPVSTGLVAKSGQIIGENVASMVNFFNPAIVVIGGVVASAGDPFLAAIRQIVYRRSMPLATRNLRIVPAANQDIGGVLGGAQLALDQLFVRDRLRTWIGDGSPLADPLRLYALSA